MISHFKCSPNRARKGLLRCLKLQELTLKRMHSTYQNWFQTVYESQRKSIRLINDPKWPLNLASIRILWLKKKTIRIWRFLAIQYQVLSDKGHSWFLFPHGLITYLHDKKEALLSKHDFCNVDAKMTTRKILLLFKIWDIF